MGADFGEDREGHGSQIREPPGGLLEKKYSSSREEFSITPSRTGGQVKRDSDQQRYVEDRLFELIGPAERQGRSGRMWERALAAMPDELNELISHVIMLEKSGQLRGRPAAWLNRSVYAALQLKGKA